MIKIGKKDLTGMSTPWVMLTTWLPRRFSEYAHSPANDLRSLCTGVCAYTVLLKNRLADTRPTAYHICVDHISKRTWICPTKTKILLSPWTRPVKYLLGLFCTLGHYHPINQRACISIEHRSLQCGQGACTWALRDRICLPAVEPSALAMRWGCQIGTNCGYFGRMIHWDPLRI